MGILKVTKTIRCTAYYHLYLSKHYAFEMRTQFFDFERLKPVRVTKRNLQEDRRGNLICCMQCGRVISLRTGRGSKKKTPRPTGLFETFQSFFLGAGYPDVDPSPSSKTTVSNFCFFFPQVLLDETQQHDQHENEPLDHNFDNEATTTYQCTALIYRNWCVLFWLSTLLLRNDYLNTFICLDLLKPAKRGSDHEPYSRSSTVSQGWNAFIAQNWFTVRGNERDPVLDGEHR